MSKYTNLTAVFVLAALLAACSVEKKTVANNPPIIPNRVMTFDNEFGRLKPESVTVFLWPVFSSELEAENAIAKVNRASKAIDLLTIDFSNMSQDESLRQKEFEDLGCLDFAVLESDDPGETPEWITDWKEPANDKMAKDIQLCVGNQSSRQRTQASKALINSNQVNHLKELMGVIDPDGIGNWKKTNPRQSKLEFKQNAAEIIEASITFKDFGVAGNTQSTEEGVSTLPEGRITGVTYDMSRKVLTFQMPEIEVVAVEVIDEATGETVKKDKLIATGAVYHFVLERANFLNFAKFAGDVKLVYPDGNTRVGSASIYGPLKAE